MKFVKIAGHVINVGQILRVEVFDTNRIDIYFAGSNEPLGLYGDEADTLVDALEAKDLLVAKQSFERLESSLKDPGSPWDDPNALKESC